MIANAPLPVINCLKPSRSCMAPIEAVGLPLLREFRADAFDVGSRRSFSNRTLAATNSLVRTHSNPPVETRRSIISRVSVANVLMLPLETTRSYTCSI